MESGEMLAQLWPVIVVRRSLLSATRRSLFAVHVLLRRFVFVANELAPGQPPPTSQRDKVETYQLSASRSTWAASDSLGPRSEWPINLARLLAQANQSNLAQAHSWRRNSGAHLLAAGPQMEARRSIKAPPTKQGEKQISLTNSTSCAGASSAELALIGAMQIGLVGELLQVRPVELSAKTAPLMSSLSSSAAWERRPI